MGKRTANRTCRAPRCKNELQSFAWYGYCGYHLIEIYDTILRIGGPRALPEWNIYWVPELEERRAEFELVTGQTYHDPDLDGPRQRTPEQPKRQPKQSQPGTIYYVKVGEHIKVGWTANMEQRMRSYPPNSVLLASEPGTRADEKRRHKMFAAHRSHGNEWYVPAPSVLHHIDMVKAKHGEPDPAAFAARPVEIPQPRERHYIGGNNRGNWQRGEIRG